MTTHLQIAIVTESLLLMCWGILYIYSRVIYNNTYTYSYHLYSYRRFLKDSKNIGFYLSVIKIISILYPLLYGIGYILLYLYIWAYSSIILT